LASERYSGQYFESVSFGVLSQTRSSLWAVKAEASLQVTPDVAQAVPNVPDHCTFFEAKRLRAAVPSPHSTFGLQPVQLASVPPERHNVV